MATHTSTNTRPFVFHFGFGLVILASGQNCQEAEDLAMDYAHTTGMTPKGEEPFLTNWLTWKEAVSTYPTTNLDLTDYGDDDCIIALMSPRLDTPVVQSDADDFDFESDADVFHTPDADVFLNPEHAWV
jgi:hypothetical protein